MSKKDKNVFIVGLVGASGSGKTTVANHLKERRGFTLLQIGQPIKDMLECLGVEKKYLTGTPDERNFPLKLLDGKSARFAMSKLGSDWGRNEISKNIWLNVLMEKISVIASRSETENALVVIDDMRFPNDWKLLEKYEGVIIRVRRPNIEPTRSLADRVAVSNSGNFIGMAMGLIGFAKLHESEYYWRDAPANFELFNDGTVDEIIVKIEFLDKYL